MSHETSIDDEVKAILAQAGSDDSTEENNSKKDVQEKPSVKDKEVKVDDGIDWETNTEETPDSEW